MQSEIASKVAVTLGIALTSRDESLLGERPTVNVAAYDAFLRGEENFRQRAANDTAGLEYDLSLYERAVALDPDFPEAWARLAVTCSELYRLGVSAPAMRERAEHAAERAATLNPDNPDVLMAHSTNEQVLHNNLEGALEICAEGRRRWPTDALILNQTANLEVCLGRWDDAVEHYRQGSRLDPRLSWGLGEVLTGLRRYPEALEAIEHALAISPLNLQLIQDEVNIFVAQGDLARARAVLEKAEKEVEPTALVAFMATQPEDFDVGWVLDGRQRELLLRAAPSAFGGDRGQWGLTLALASALDGEVSKTRAYAEEARKGFEEQLKTQPNNHRTLAALGLALAYLGYKEQAIQTGQRAALAMPVTKDASEGMVALSNLVRIYILVGQPENALDQLEQLMKLPGLWSPGWLRIDPNFDPLRKNPRFQKLVGGAK
jgi:tetratricopeptide (TPR) repeat protein